SYNNGSGFQLQWAPVAGVTQYNLYFRNTTGSGAAGFDRRQWVGPFTAATSVVDSAGVKTVVASNVMQSQFSSFGTAVPLSVGTVFSPWAFKNGVEVAVVPVTPAGFEPAIDPTKVLKIEDGTGPFISASNGG